MEVFYFFTGSPHSPVSITHGVHRLQTPAMLRGHRVLTAAAAPWSCHNCTPAFLFNASLFFQLCCHGLLLSDVNHLERIPSQITYSPCLMQSQQKCKHFICHCSQLLFWGAVGVSQLTPQRLRTPIARFF